MEILRGIPRIPTDTIEFVNLCPEKWKCDACGIIVSSLWRNNYVTNTSYPTTTTKNSISYSLSPLTLSTACSHRFCALCLDKLFSGISVDTKCPFDSVVLRKKQMMEDPINTELILQQEVYCSHKSRGCRKVMALSELETHLKACLYGLVHCPLKCGQGITIKSLPNHMASLCPRRVIACQYCDEDIPLDSKADHENNCHKKPVICNYCNNQSLLQGEMKTHLEKCALKPRNCKLIPLGCKYSGTQAEVEEHESRWGSHMDIVLKHILQNNNISQDKSKNRLADIVQIVKNLNSENAELTDRVNELTERVESLQSSNKTLIEQLVKLETIQKADIASMRTLIEVLRKELEEFKTNIAKQREDDEESEV